MKVKITNFRGVSRADLETAPITLIAGRNHSGKTSLYQALCAALTGRTMPIDGLTKSHATMLVHAGTAEASIDLDSATGTVSLRYPSLSREIVGAPMETTEYAAGLSSLVDVKAKERAEVVANLLHTVPSSVDLAAELELLGFPAAVADLLWKKIEGSDWDAAYAAAREKGAKLKGAWEAATNENFGTQKAESWLPATWEADLETTIEPELSKALLAEQEWLEAAISHAAVSDSEAARLQNIVAGESAATTRVEELSGELKALLGTEATLRRALATMPSSAQPVTQPCPHCGKPVSIVSGALAAPTVLTDDEVKQRTAAIDDSRRSLADIKAKINGVNDLLGQARSHSAAIAEAKKQLAAHIEQSDRDTDGAGRVDDCRARVAHAEARLNAFRAKATADRTAAAIAENQKILAVLAPDGLRQRFLRNKLDGFNSKLAQLCDVADYRRVSLSSDMQIAMGGSPYMLLSESEQYRVRVALQVAFALAQQAGMVLIDRADILDGPGRNGLVKMLVAAKIPAVICMTLDRCEQVPDISRVGGRAYWMDGGVAT